MKTKFYALYKGTNDVLVFDTKKERDFYVSEERIVHPDCVCVTYGKIKKLIEGRSPVFDCGFGCFAILS